MYADAGAFRIVEPAIFVNVADGASAEIVTLPVHDAPISWSDAPGVAYRASITRRLL